MNEQKKYISKQAKGQQASEQADKQNIATKTAIVRV
jgi:hypothetical protein